MQAPTPAFDPAMTCPRCGAPATPSYEFGPCKACAGVIVLLLGRAVDGRIQPQATLNDPPIRVKSAGLVLMKQGEVGPYGVSEGTLDPVTGMIPMDQSGVGWNDIRSIAVWRKVDVMSVVAATMLPLPMGLLCIAIAIAIPSAVPAAFGLPFLFIAGYMYYRAIVIRAHWVRIAGVYRTITIRFDRPGRRRHAFYSELLRRAGVPATPPIP